MLSADYTIEYYTEEYSGYSKKYSKVVFLNYTPAVNQVLEITYTKSTQLFTAAERILDYYNPTLGMPGSNLSQLMMGIDYPKTKIEGLMFTSTQAWDLLYPSGESTPFGISSYADNIGYYTKTKIASNASVGTSTIILNTTTGIKVGQYANIISTVTNMFNTSSVTVIGVTTATGAVTFSSTITNTLVASTTTYQIEFWNYDSNSNLLDSAIDGGNLGYSTALGINPEDITIDGDKFYTPNTSYAPEEFVPGQASDSIGINVYTKNLQGAPVVYTGSVGIQYNQVTYQKLGMLPVSINNITVSFNGTLFNYSTSTSFTSTLNSNLFSINWATSEIIVGPQSVSGMLGYTVLSIGGGTDAEMGTIDSAIVIAQENDTVAQVVSLSSFDSVKTVYVTLNGVPITSTNNFDGITPYYELTYANEDDRRAAVNVNNLAYSQINTVQAWFFGTQYDFFNEIREQIFTITTTTSLTFTLINPPGPIEPVSASAIVEYYNPATNILRRLISPRIDYYEVISPTNNIFKINNQGTFATYDNTVKVYRNGQIMTAGFDYIVDTGNSDVVISSSISVGDVIAIVDLPAGAEQDYEYDIVGSILTLVPGVGSQLAWASTSSGYIKVLTYTDRDDMLIRTERFDGNANRRFKLSRAVYDTNYVWVQLNGIPLTARLDYEILDDQVTIQISDAYHITSSDFVVITSMVAQSLATTVVGYRIFNDMFNRTHYKRLSKENTTYLTQPLNFYDTEIYVADSDVLTPPLVAKHIPGVVIIDGERIEFFKMDKNVLRQLRRSTLGTAPSFFSDIGTKVIDQSPDQTIPFNDTIKNQYHYTTSTVNATVLNTSTNLYTFVISTTSYFTTSTDLNLESDGITLSTSTTAVDQVQVFYGGRLLRKSGIYVQDTTISYDSPDLKNIEISSTSTVQGLPITGAIGTGYNVTATNQVWVYTGSTEPDAVSGYVYRGLNYVPPEFSITTATQAVTLNIVGGIDYKVKLQVVKKEFSTSTLWNDINANDPGFAISLLDSLSLPAKFLQERPAELPDKYYYGGSLTLTTSAGAPLTDIDNNPLQGF